MKRKASHGGFALLCPKGTAGVQVAAGVTEFGRNGEEIPTLHTPIVPCETGRAVGSVPRLLAGKRIPVGYWESVTPPDHTHSQRPYVKRDGRQKEKDSGRGAALSCSLDHEERRQRCGHRAEKKKSDMSLVQRYALVYSTLRRCCRSKYICCETVEPERPLVCWTVNQTCTVDSICTWDHELPLVKLPIHHR